MDIEYTDKIMRNVVVVLLLGWLLWNASVFEAPYPIRSVNLYPYPGWRFLIIFMVFLGAVWCPRVGLAAALVAFFYLSDMKILLQSFKSS
jgi:hypothetical protein